MVQARQFLSGSAWNIGGIGISQVIGLAVLAYMARNLDARDFGIVAISILVLELSRDLMLAGFPDLLVREKVWRADLADSCFVFQILAGSALAAIALGAGATVSAVISPEIGRALMVMSSIYVIEALGSVALAQLRHQMAYRAIGLGQILGAIATAVTGVLSVYWGSGFMALVYSRIAAVLTVSVTSLLMSQWRPKLIATIAPLRPLFPMALNIVSSKLLGILNVKATDLIIGIIGGPALLGSYQLASRLLNFVLQTILGPVQAVSLSLFAGQKGDEQLQATLAYVLSILALIVFPVATGMAMVAPEFVRIFFGDGWDHLIVPMAVLMLACLPASINYLLYPVLVRIDRTQLSVRFVATLTLTGVALTLVSVGFGLLAVALAFTARTALGGVLAAQMLRQELQFEVARLLRSLAVPTFGSLALAASVAMMRAQLGGLSDLERMLALMLTGAVAYVVVVAVPVARLRLVLPQLAGRGQP